MAAMAPSVQWTPDDDVLLKNAVEGGASLESLAKGAVEFSRRYTIREVKERWCQILFNQANAMETSLHVTSLGLETCLPGNLRPGKLFSTREKERPPGWRKSSSVRSLYYDLRKRMRSGQVESPELNYLAPASAATDFGGEGEGSHSKPLTDLDQFNRVREFNFDVSHNAEEQGMEGDIMIDEPVIPSDGLFEFEEIMPVPPVNRMANGDIGSMEKLEMRSPQESQNPSLEDSDNDGSLQNLRFSPSLASMTLWGGIEATLTPPVNPHLSSSDVKEISQENKLRDDLCMEGVNDSTMIGDNEFVDLSLEFDHDDEELFLLNEEEKDIMDGPRLDTIFSDSPVNVHHDAGYDSADMTKDVEDIIAKDMAHDEFEFTEDQIVCPADDDGGGCATIQDNSETIEMFKNCVLNTEDWEIPCNDDVVLPNEVTIPTAASSRGGTKKLEPEVGGVSHSSKINSLVEAQMLAKSATAKHLSDGFKIKTEFQGLESDKKNLFLPAVGPLTRSILTPKEEVGSLGPEKCGYSFQEKSHEPPDHPKTDQMVDAAAPSQRWATEPQFDDPCQNFSSSDDDNLSSYSDDEMPHFSDVESMILDNDLAFSDQEPSMFAREAARYQFLESKKTLMRLEKSAQAKTERSIRSHGAFAVLYGRYLRHYFRKPEVSLGRGTDDILVDIDLKREGPANKISRRQAIIKMDEQGMFHLKNTGKFPILNNGSEVPPGMQVSISSGCLIDIRGMKFIFEVCPSRVARYIANTWRGKAAQEPNPSFPLVAV